jgi:hypothetical protein
MIMGRASVFAGTVVLGGLLAAFALVLSPTHEPTPASQTMQTLGTLEALVRTIEPRLAEKTASDISRIDMEQALSSVNEVVDGWGNHFRVTFVCSQGRWHYTLSSNGPDGVAGALGDDLAVDGPRTKAAREAARCVEN